MERLEKNVIHDICTNQVVVTLHACVKELVENSLDAGATRIEVRLRESGADLLEVLDDGKGVSSDNHAMLATRHATSKIRDYEDLSSSLSTFGFRGEALAGICAMGDMTVCTRTSTASTASLLVYDHYGKLTSTTSAAREVGTTVSVRDLFRRLPVRHREFMRNAKAQVSATLRLIQSFAIANPGIKFHVIAEKSRGSGAGRVTLLSTSGSSLGWIQAAASVLGDSVVSDCKPLELESAGGAWKISGAISMPHGGRRSRDMQLFFVNARPVDPPKRIVKLINDTFHQYNSRLYPVILLSFTASQGLVDVNVTPDKRTVFLHNEEALLGDIQKSLTDLWAPADRLASTSLASFGVRSVVAMPMQTESAAASEFYSQDVSFDAFSASSGAAQPEVHVPVVPILDSETTDCVRASSEQLVEASDDVDPFFDTPEKPVLAAGPQLAFGDCTQGPSKRQRRELAPPPSASSTGAPVDFQLVLSPEGSTDASLAPTDVDGSSAVGQFEITTSDVLVPPTPSKCGNSLQVCVKLSDLEGAISRRRAAAASTRAACSLVRQVDHSQTTTSDLRFPSSFSLSSLGSSGAVEAQIDEVAKFNVGSDTGESAPFKMNKSCFEQMRVIGQFNLGFVIAALRTGADDSGNSAGSQLFIVDQHASDEKFRFEGLNRESKIDKQPLVTPLSLQLSPAQEAIVVSNFEVFRLNGFEIKSHSDRPPGRRLSVKALPTCQGMVFGEKDIHDLIFTLEEGEGGHTLPTPQEAEGVEGQAGTAAVTSGSRGGLLDMTSHRALWSAGSIPRPSKVWQLLACRACRGAIMIGKALRVTEMERILRNLGGLEQPWNCPHGRPTLRHLVDTVAARRLPRRDLPLPPVLGVGPLP